MCGLNKRQKMSDAGSHTLLSASILALININSAVSKLKGQTGLHYLELLPGLKRDFGKWLHPGSERWWKPSSRLQELRRMRFL